jgi:hypothetical protein
MSFARSRRNLTGPIFALSLLTAACADRGSAFAAMDEAPPPTAASTPQSGPIEDEAQPEAADEDGAKATARMVIRTARVQLRADAPAEVVARAIGLAERAGGFVASSETHGVGADVDQATATLRVPADAFQSVLASLRAEGELLGEQLGGDDVTDRYVDLTARLRSQRTLEERLLDILGKVVSVEDALQVETQLARVRTEIEQLDGQRRAMEDRVSFATVDLVVSSPVRHNAPPAETVSSMLDRAVDDAGRAFLAVVTGLIRILGGLLPLGLVFGPIAWALQRGVRRRRAARALVMHASSRPPPGPPPGAPPARV